MACTKPRGRYAAISLPEEFVKVVKDHVKNSYRYRSMAEFVKVAVINQLDKENPGVIV